MGTVFHQIRNGLETITALTMADENEMSQSDRVLLVPSEDVLLIEAALPRALPKRLARQAAPNIVEDFLSMDPAELHFAYPDRAPMGKVMPMAVCDPDALRGWIARCEAAPGHVVPDVLALPLHEDGWTLYLEPGRCLIRTGAFAGHAVDPRNLAVMLEAIAKETGPPDRLHLYGESEPDRAALAGYNIETHQGSFAGLIHFQPDQAIDLLQGHFKGRHPITRQLRPWLPVAGILLLWWLTATINAALNLNRLKMENQTAEALVSEAFTRLMPKGTRMVNPRIQAERHLAGMQRRGSANPLLPMLAVLGQTVSATGDISLERLDYRNKGLEIQIQSKDIQRPEKLVQQLNANGIQARMKQVNLNQGVVTATIGLQPMDNKEAPPAR